MGISISPQYTQREYKWTAWKSVLAVKNFAYQSDSDDSAYFIWGYDGPEVHMCIIYKNDVPQPVIDAGYSQEQNDADKANYLASYAAKANRSIEQRTSAQGIIRAAIHKPEGSSATKVSYDWCDKCTWYQNSIRITDETLTTSDSLTFDSAHAAWIDLTHGRLYEEDLFIAGREIVVKVDDVVVTTGFSVDYTTGKIVFDATQSGTVKASYNYATTSVWTLGPTTGKIMHIEHAEVQFAKDVAMNSPMTFEIWVYHPSGNGTKVLYQRITYKNEKDIINAANLGQGSIPRFGNLPDDILVFPFDYATIKTLKYSQGAELRVSINNDVKLTGSYATITFYILSQDE